MGNVLSRVLRVSAKGLLAFLAVFVPSLIVASSASAAVVINEVESSAPGDGPDYIEIYNTGPSAVDISGYYFKDSNNSRTLQAPGGTNLPVGGFYTASMADDLPAPADFGLGGNDAARVFESDNATLVDTFTYTSAAVTTYGRCPDGVGALTNQTKTGTKNGPNDCATLTAWPGGSSVTGAATLGTDVSGLAYQPSGTSAPGTLYASKNDDGTLFRLVKSGSSWVNDTTNGWASGKALKYPGGVGIPDAEGITLVPGEPNSIYVSTERDGGNGTRPAILKYDISGAGTTLIASRDWNLTPDLPAFPANGSLESIAWVPDSVLVAKGFHDDITGLDYSAASYAGHGTGLFFVGAELDGTIYAYALNQSTNTFNKVATFSSGQPSVADLEYEPETQRLYAECDNNCSGRVFALEIAQSGVNDGKFVPTGTYERPTGMPNVNNEGFAIAPQAECSGGTKPAFWVEDADLAGQVLRQGTINCTDLPANPDPDTDGDGVPNATDGCPTVAGPASNNGCPVTTPNPPDDDKACDAAKAKLKKAKAKLAKLKKADAPAKKIKGAKAKVKKAKARVKKAC